MVNFLFLLLLFLASTKKTPEAETNKNKIVQENHYIRNSFSIYFVCVPSRIGRSIGVVIMFRYNDKTISRLDAIWIHLNFWFFLKKRNTPNKSKNVSISCLFLCQCIFRRTLFSKCFCWAFFTSSSSFPYSTACDTKIKNVEYNFGNSIFCVIQYFLMVFVCLNFVLLVSSCQ